VEVADADSNRKILCLMPCIFTSFVGGGQTPRSGSMMQRGPAHEETSRCLSARRYLDRRCDG
jgi:hypothetical protein